MSSAMASILITLRMLKLLAMTYIASYIVLAKFVAAIYLSLTSVLTIYRVVTLT